MDPFLAFMLGDSHRAHTYTVAFVLHVKDTLGLFGTHVTLVVNEFESHTAQISFIFQR